MQIFRSFANLRQLTQPVFIAVGVFDGIHLGHQKLLQTTLNNALAGKGSGVVLTFDPHPVKVLRPEHAPRLLTSQSHKMALLEKLGIENCLVLPFDEILAATPPDQFIGQLANSCRLAQICVGHQWTFGKKRSGNVPLLRELGKGHGFEVVEIDPVFSEGRLVSSTRIRTAVETGDLLDAQACLGRNFSILGTVQEGEQIGRKLGFPTANLAAHNEQFPPNGVYVIRADWRKQKVQGVANIGRRPTVHAQGQRQLEVHLFDFDQTIYGDDIEVAFLHCLRPEQKFENLDALQAQIRRDVVAARDFFHNYPE